MIVKLPDLKIPDYVKDKYEFALNYYPPDFPPLPTSEMTLDFAPPFLRWFIYGGNLKVLKNESLKPNKRVTLTKHDVYSFKGHLHVDIEHVTIESHIHECEERKGTSKLN